MDLQTILVVLLVLAASLYTGRRVFSRLRGFSSKGESCETGCGKCGTDSTPARFIKL